MSIGRTIKVLRISAGFTQSEFADMIAVSSNYLSLVENNHKEPSLAVLKRISDSLKLPMGVLFLDIDSNIDNASAEERAIILRIKDLALEISRLRLREQKPPVDAV